MKKTRNGIRTTKIIKISVPLGLVPLIKEEALRHSRNVSSFLVWLVRKDLEKKTFS